MAVDMSELVNDLLAETAPLQALLAAVLAHEPEHVAGQLALWIETLRLLACMNRRQIHRLDRLRLVGSDPSRNP